VQQTGKPRRGCQLITDIYRCKTENKGAPIDKFTRPGIVGDYDYGGFDDKKRVAKSLDTTIFFDIPANIPQQPGEHSTFMWRSRSIWLMTQAARWGQIQKIPKNAEEMAGLEK